MMVYVRKAASASLVTKQLDDRISVRRLYNKLNCMAQVVTCFTEQVYKVACCYLFLLAGSQSSNLQACHSSTELMASYL